jgi:hypothetical protein
VFGFSQELVRNKLPTKEDVFKAYLWVRAQQLEQESQVKTTDELLKIVAEQVITIWEKASIPTIPFPSILAQLKKTVKRVKNYKNILKTREHLRNFCRRRKHLSSCLMFALVSVRAREFLIETSADVISKFPDWSGSFGVIKSQREI